NVTVAAHDRPAKCPGKAAPGRLDLLALVEGVAVGRADELDLGTSRIRGESRLHEQKHDRAQRGEDREAEQRSHGAEPPGRGVPRAGCVRRMTRSWLEARWAPVEGGPAGTS